MTDSRKQRKEGNVEKCKDEMHMEVHAPRRDFKSLWIFLLLLLLLNSEARAVKMNKQVKTLATKTDNLSLILGTHLVKGEKQLWQVVL